MHLGDAKRRIFGYYFNAWILFRLVERDDHIVHMNGDMCCTVDMDMSNMVVIPVVAIDGNQSLDPFKLPGHLHKKRAIRVNSDVLEEFSHFTMAEQYPDYIDLPENVKLVLVRDCLLILEYFLCFSVRNKWILYFLSRAFMELND